MDFIAEDVTLQAILGRSDFVGGIDNEALDFSQLEAFINSGADGNGDGVHGPAAATATFFPDTLHNDRPNVAIVENTVIHGRVKSLPKGSLIIDTGLASPGKINNVIVIDSKKHASGHQLPESPPDSGSEHPYSPADTSDPHLTPGHTNENVVYTTLGELSNFKQESNEQLNGQLLLSAQVQAQHPQHLLLESKQRCILVQNELRSPPQKLPPRHNPITLDVCSIARDPSPHYQLLNTPPNMDLQTIPQTDIATHRRPINDALLDASLDLQTHPFALTDVAPVSVGSGTPVAKKRKLSSGNGGKVKSEFMDYSSLKVEDLAMDTNKQLMVDHSEDFGDGNSMDGAMSNSGLYSEQNFQCIKFSAFKTTQWHALIDQDLKDLPVPYYRVDADKGFNFSNADESFVCQKKNHFQITCHIQINGNPQFVRTLDGLQKINNFFVHFFGVKYESPSQSIKIEQSQSDRSKKPFHPVMVDLQKEKITKITVGRLHFSETTSNNMRKKGKPNPEQRYFQLVVELHAHTAHAHYPITSLASERIIVRASNPGQFESDMEPCWQRGQTHDSIYHMGKIGVNTDRPEEAIVVHGNMKITGNIVHPSDCRAKQNIQECNTAEQLRNVQKLRVVKYRYQPEFAIHSGITDPGSVNMGVIAQEVAQVIPDAVITAGNVVLPSGDTIDNFLFVNKERIFMENIGAVKELCKVTDNLETRIDQLEKINRRLAKLKRGDSLSSNTSTVITITSNKSRSTRHGSSKSYAKTKLKCDADQEICTNKIIHITIIVLVLIMAFCLAAITGLYFVESRNHLRRRDFYDLPRKSTKSLQTTVAPDLKFALITSGPNPIYHDDNYQSNSVDGKITKSYIKSHPWYRESSVKNIDNRVTTADNESNTNTIPRQSANQNIHANAHRDNTINIPLAIGHQPFCSMPNTDYLNDKNCEIFCCDDYKATVQNQLRTPLDPKPKTFPTTNLKKIEAKPEWNGTKTSGKIAKIHPNTIGKKDARLQKRNTAVDWTDQDSRFYDDNNYNFYHSDQVFTVTIQSPKFNVTLNEDYCTECASYANVTCTIPVSKHLPDEFLYLNFRNSKMNIRQLEFCYKRMKLNKCHDYDTDINELWMQQHAGKNKESIWSPDDDKSGFRRYGMRFEVNIRNHISQSVTYRGSLVDNIQNVCDLPSTKLGVDFLEYNFYIYRDCEF